MKKLSMLFSAMLLIGVVGFSSCKSKKVRKDVKHGAKKVKKDVKHAGKKVKRHMKEDSK